MAKGDEVAAVFDILEKIFNTELEYEYDEGLEELGLHTAKVRKTYPNLFKAMQFPSRLTPQQVAPVINDEWMARFSEILKGTNGHAQPLQRIPPAEQPMYRPPAVDPAAVSLPMEVPDAEPAIKSVPYSEWASNGGAASRANMGEEFVYRWDIPNVPAKQVTETFVLKNREDGGRTRFHVIDLVDDMTYHVKVVAILPRGD